MKRKICCFAGHGKYSIDDETREKLYAKCEELILNEDVKEFWVGHYGSFDGTASRTVRELQKKYPNIKLFLVIPYVTKGINDYKEIYYKDYDEILMADMPENTPNTELKVNDEIKILDVPAQLIDSRTLVPVRAIAESFGVIVDWDNNTRTVIMKTPKVEPQKQDVPKQEIPSTDNTKNDAEVNDKPVAEAKELSCSLSVSNSMMQVGNYCTIVFKATATGKGGTEPYKYKFEIIQDGKSVKNTTYSSDNVFEGTIKDTIKESCIVKVYVKDGKGDTFEKEHNFIKNEVSEPQENETKNNEPIDVSLTERITVDKDDVITITPKLTPSNAETTYYWSSEDPSIAKVTSAGIGLSGNVTGVSEGKTTITVETANGLTATCDVTVIDKAGVTSISIKDSIEIKKGFQEDIDIKLSPSGAKSLYSIESSDTDIVSVSTTGGRTGVRIRGVSSGVATITVYTDNGLSASCEVTVIGAPDPTDISIPSSHQMKGGTSWDIPIIISPNNCATSYSITTSDDSVAKVSTTGGQRGCRVKAFASGTATITVYTENGLSATCEITVTE